MSITLKLSGIDENENDIHMTVGGLKTVRVLGDIIEVVHTDGKVEDVAYGYSDDNNCMYWRERPMFIEGVETEGYWDLPEYFELSVTQT